MPRACTICTHHERETIDRLLVEGTAFPAIAAKHRVSTDALGRHKAAHLPLTLVKAQEAEEVASAGNLLDKMTELVTAARIGRKAELKGDYRNALMAIRVQERIIELCVRLLGELNNGAQTQGNNGLTPTSSSVPNPFIQMAIDKSRDQWMEESNRKAQPLIDTNSGRLLPPSKTD